jgi:murein DD-endopeptidase MepM/ murein hydrolase activator NlpD
MRRALLLLAIPPLLSLPVPGFPQDIVKHAGQVTFLVDSSQAFPGGLFVVRLQAQGALGAAYAAVDGQRAPFFMAAKGPRALVPIPLTAVPGPTTLGVELMARRGRQRIPLSVTIARRDYPARTVTIPETKRPLLKQPSVTHDARQLLLLLRTESPDAPGPLKPPITVVDGHGFGGIQTWVGGSPVESMLDGMYGEEHRGLDYEVPPGTVVMAPAAGTVLFAGPMALGGQTLVLDHGQGILTVLFHLSRIDVIPDSHVEARAAVGYSGETGLAVSPQVEWRTYLHGVAVDPRTLDRLD